MTTWPDTFEPAFPSQGRAGQPVRPCADPRPAGSLSPISPRLAAGFVLAMLCFASGAHTAPIAPMPAKGSWQATLVLEEKTAKQPAAASEAAEPEAETAEQEPLPPTTIIEVTSKSSQGLEERVAKFADGSTRTLYRAKKATIAQTSADNPFFFLLDRDTFDSDLFSEPGYFGCQGLQDNHRKGEEEKFEVPALRFEIPGAKDRSGEAEAIPVRVVWIEKSTRRPLAVRIGPREYAFKFNDSDPGKPKLHPEARKVWVNQKSALAVAFGLSALERTPFDD